MLLEITRNNLEEIENNKVISKEYILQELQANPFGKFLVLKKDNKIIGYIYYSDIYERAEINQFEIDKTYRNKGLGNILLNEAIKRLDKEITLEVKKDNLIARKLYEKNGFKEVGVRENYYDGQDGILYEYKPID